MKRNFEQETKERDRVEVGAAFSDTVWIDLPKRLGGYACEDVDQLGHQTDRDGPRTGGTR